MFSKLKPRKKLQFLYFIVLFRRTPFFLIGMTSPAVADVVGKLKHIGLDDKNATDFAKNADRSAEVLTFFEAQKAMDADPRVRMMVFNMFSKLKPHQHRETCAQFLLSGRIKTTPQADAATRYLSALKSSDAFVEDAFVKSCGSGIEVTKADITAAVSKAIDTVKDRLLAERYKFNAGQIMGVLKKDTGVVRWAEGSSVKEEVEAQIQALLGPRTAEDDAAPVKAKPAEKEKPAKVTAEPTLEESHMTPNFVEVGKGMTVTEIGSVPALDGKPVLIKGWAHRVRHQAKISFIVMRDSTGFVQVVLPWRVPHFHRETSLVIVGTVKHEPKAQGDNTWQLPYEILATEWSIIGNSDGEIENVVTAESAPDVLFDQRHLVLRGNNACAVMTVRAAVLRGFREFFYSRRMLEVTPPTLVQTQCEGGATLFELGFYGEKAFLTQSSQLYLETCIPSMGPVYCITSSYRAEKSKTRRHLSEFTHVEAEFPNISFEDLLTFLENMMVDVMARVFADVGDLIAQHNKEALVSPDADPKKPESWKIMPKLPFARMNYTDAIKFLNDNNIINPETEKHFAFGDDITDKSEREMVALIGKPVLLMRFPAEMKAFYMSKCEEDRTLTESVDVLMPGVGETVGGSMRIWDYEELLAAYKKQELDPTPYYWYTDQRKFGSVPHGGFGLGLERMLVWLMSLEHVKDSTLYPRLMNRCTP
eukprot:PhM_4_TR17554/c1_g1_i1/m.55217/K01893/NARS, asnS; asparaginyl-tRNA synthetase